MRLAEYLEKNDLTPQEFSERIDTSRAAVQRYAAGKRVPTRRIMDRIRVATDGQVTANDFYPGAGPKNGDGGGEVGPHSTTSPPAERISATPINRRSAAAKKAARTRKRMAETRATG